MGPYLVPIPDDASMEAGATQYCFYTLLPTLHPGLAVHTVTLPDLDRVERRYGVKGLVSDWLEVYGAGFKQTVRQGFLLGVCCSS